VARTHAPATEEDLDSDSEDLLPEPADAAA